MNDVDATRRPILEIEKCSASEPSELADPIRRTSQISTHAKGSIHGGIDIIGGEHQATTISEEEVANNEEQQNNQAQNSAEVAEAGHKEDEHHQQVPAASEESKNNDRPSLNEEVTASAVAGEIH